MEEHWHSQCHPVPPKASLIHSATGGNVSMAEPYYNPQRAIYLGQDDIPGFLKMYYTLLVDGMDRQTYVTGEYRHGQQNLPWGDAEYSNAGPQGSPAAAASSRGQGDPECDSQRKDASADGDQRRVDQLADGH
jgi:hypothetical protein